MPTQKTFKRRVRARMDKTGESYTAARGQLLRKATEPAVAAADPTVSDGSAVGPTPMAEVVPADAQGVSDDAMVRATGRTHAEWFAILDEWGATGHGHTEIARWLSETQGVPGWWTQSITVAYERARGMRARHQMRDGYSVSVTRTVNVDPKRALDAFTNTSLRDRWLPDAPMRQRPTRAALAARFDWSDPPSRVVVTVVPKGVDKSVVAVTHEQVQDGNAAERLKVGWRGWLSAMKTVLEGG
jgi:hypothetical protein